MSEITFEARVKATGLTPKPEDMPKLEALVLDMDRAAQVPGRIVGRDDDGDGVRHGRRCGRTGGPGLRRGMRGSTSCGCDYPGMSRAMLKLSWRRCLP